jgi:lambda repressor-like predicted transcriptional regulator
MHPEEVKAALRMRGITQAILAEAHGVTRTAVRAVIVGQSKSQRIQEAISRVIDKPVSDIWPGQVRLRRTRAQIEAAQIMKVRKPT